MSIGWSNGCRQMWQTSSSPAPSWKLEMWFSDDSKPQRPWRLHPKGQPILCCQVTIQV
ncbi:hypothetical protein GDO78_019448 [Eleutherodactylus coqui]|uniref:Uncharacterized protein n=1 Tax=Eleutherodactylus coqui TaxID=57060 RepID=A0A8J6B4Z4_ELECQ|nr:hypothetical protein GDO78_019448 [Eleutherodactylus coqui]